MSRLQCGIFMGFGCNFRRLSISNTCSLWEFTFVLVGSINMAASELTVGGTERNIGQWGPTIVDQRQLFPPPQTNDIDHQSRETSVWVPLGGWCLMFLNPDWFARLWYFCSYCKPTFLKEVPLWSVCYRATERVPFVVFSYYVACVIPSVYRPRTGPHWGCVWAAYCPRSTYW